MGPLPRRHHDNTPVFVGRQIRAWFCGEGRSGVGSRGLREKEEEEDHSSAFIWRLVEAAAPHGGARVACWSRGALLRVLFLPRLSRAVPRCAPCFRNSPSRRHTGQAAYTPVRPARTPSRQHADGPTKNHSNGCVLKLKATATCAEHGAASAATQHSGRWGLADRRHGGLRLGAGKGRDLLGQISKPAAVALQGLWALVLRDKVHAISWPPARRDAGAQQQQPSQSCALSKRARSAKVRA